MVWEFTAWASWSRCTTPQEVEAADARRREYRAIQREAKAMIAGFGDSALWEVAGRADTALNRSNFAEVYRLKKIYLAIRHLRRRAKSRPRRAPPNLFVHTK